MVTQVIVMMRLVSAPLAETQSSYDVLCFTYMASSASCTLAYIHMAVTINYRPCCRLEDLCLMVKWLPDLTLSL